MKYLLILLTLTTSYSMTITGSAPWCVVDKYANNAQCYYWNYDSCMYAAGSYGLCMMR